MNFYPLLPLWLILLLVLLSGAVTAYSYRRRNPAVAPWQHVLLLSLRAASIALVAVMLLCPGHMTEERNREKSHIVFLLDRSASMATQDLPARLSRLEQATAYLKEHRFKRLSDYPMDTFSFNSQTQRQADGGELAALKPEGGTDFKQVIARIDKDIGLNRTAAIVLLSDGIDYSGFKGNEIDVPILSVPIGTDLATAKDVGIEPFKCPDKVSEGEELTLDIPILMQGYAQEKNVSLNVSVDKASVHDVKLALSSGRPHTEPVKLTLARPGIHVISIACEAFPDEVTALNNRRELAVEVVKAKDEVVVYFPVLNNSFRPLVREFLKDEDGAFTAFYKVAENNYRLLGNKMNPLFGNGLPKTADALKNVTCLILGSHNGDLLSPAETLVIEQYVNRGGSLICLAGADSFGRLPSGSPLLRLLPVMTLETSFRTGAFRVVPEPTADGAFIEQVKAIIADNSGSADFAINGINQIKDVKANAKVMLWAESESREPLLVWQAYGRGKVIALLSNSFHLWGTAGKRDENFSRFWRQLVAFAKSLDEEADLLKVALPKTELAVGERVSVTAIARNPAGTNQALTVKADLFPVASDTPVATFPLEKKAECFMADLPALQAGRYVLRVASQDDKEVLRTRYKLVVVGDVLEESARIRVDRETFRAYSGEKHIFGLDEADRLETCLRDAVQKNVVRREKFLIFETPVFFSILVLLLLTEWFLRRRFNLF